MILYQRAEQYAGDMRAVMGQEMADQTARFYVILGFGRYWKGPNRAPINFYGRNRSVGRTKSSA